MTNIIDVQEVLTPCGLFSPDLEMLRPTEKRYTALLLQPGGPIFADEGRIGNLDVASAGKKGRVLLELASARGTHLVVTPEYYMPWNALQSAIVDGLGPAEDALWVLGCESIRPEELPAFKDAVKDTCIAIYEQPDNLAANGALLDPVVFLFRARRTDQSSHLVALIQFKTFPSRDDIFFEEGVLKRGTRVYRFRGKSGHLSVAAVICSDAFPLSDGLIDSLIDRTTLIHIQLNPNPRNLAYRAYRAKVFGTDPKASDCHIVCLNWSQSIVQHGHAGAPPEAWKNIGGSAWYCPADSCSAADEIVLPNHDKGLYYTYLRSERRHALLFHYDEAVFELHVPKLMTTGRAVMANRNGPSALHRYTWNSEDGRWDETANPPDTGFDNLLAENPSATKALEHVRDTANALGIERLLALTAGTVNGMDHWYVAKDIDSCQMEPDEVVHRITVAQDRSENACDFRHSRLARVGGVHYAILNITEWPPQVDGLNERARVLWSVENPYFNVLTEDGRPTLVVYLGESPPRRLLEDVPDKLYQLLKKNGGASEKRLCILYRQDGNPQFATIPGLTRFDDALGDMTDILAVQPMDDVGESDHA